MNLAALACRTWGWLNEVTGPGEVGDSATVWQDWQAAHVLQWSLIGVSVVPE